MININVNYILKRYIIFYKRYIIFWHKHFLIGTDSIEANCSIKDSETQIFITDWIHLASTSVQYKQKFLSSVKQKYVILSNHLFKKTRQLFCVHNDARYKYHLLNFLNICNLFLSSINISSNNLKVDYFS